MEELECKEILFSELLKSNKNHRLDAEYFSKRVCEIESFIKSKDHFYIDVKSVVSGPFGSTLKSSSYLNKGDIAFVRIENIKDKFQINTDNLVYISNKDNLRILNSQLYTDDIILSKVAHIGCFARVDDELKVCNISENNIGIKLKDYTTAQKHYILTYLNTKFGQMLIKRRQSGNVQQKLNVDDICYVPIPMFNDNFYGKISNLILNSGNLIKQSREMYVSAEEILNNAIGFYNFKPSTQNFSIKSLKESFGSSGRLDAEYYQPKYDDLFNFLASSKTNYLDELVNINKSIEPGSDFYCDEGIPFIRISDIDKFKISKPEIKLPENVFDEYLYPKKDTILFSKDGSIGLAYKVEEDLKSITSSALLHLTLKDANILPDYLTLVLNSKVVQIQAERDTNGVIIQHWRIDEIKKVIVPIVDMQTQQQISNKIKESFALRRESESLLEQAKTTVEAAIENREI